MSTGTEAERVRDRESVCVCERETESVFVRERERERETETETERVRETEAEKEREMGDRLKQLEDELEHFKATQERQEKWLLGERVREAAELRAERDRLLQEVEKLRCKLELSKNVVTKVTTELRVARELTEKLRGEVCRKDDIIAELQRQLAAVEGPAAADEQPVQKKRSFPKMPRPKLSLLRSASSPEMNPGVATATAGKQRSGVRSTSDRVSPTLLSPLLELSPTHEVFNEGTESCREPNHDVSSFHDTSQSSGATSSNSFGGTSGNESFDGSNSISSLASPAVATKASLPSVAALDMSNLRWREGKKAPEKMARGSMVVRGNTAYLRPGGSHKIYSLTLESGKIQWSSFVEGKTLNFSLVVIGNHLVSVGGQAIAGDYSTTRNVLSLSLSATKLRRLWVKDLPPMLTARCNAAAVAVGDTTLVVAGGYDKGREMDEVEVIDTTERCWRQVASLPERLSNIVAVVCSDHLYIAGGFGSQASNSVITCATEQFVKSKKNSSENGAVSSPPGACGRRVSDSGERGQAGGLWRCVDRLPVTNSTIVEFCGRVLSLGGTNDATLSATNAVYQLDADSGSWQDVCVMKNKREKCFAVTMAMEKRLVVVGGVSASGSKMDNMELADIPFLSA